MGKLSTGLLIFCLLLSGCSGWDVTLSEERNPHFRTLATLTPEQEALAFDIRKRDQSVMAEKTFYEEGPVSASFTAGRHREYRWMSGIVLNYSF